MSQDPLEKTLADLIERAESNAPASDDPGQNTPIRQFKPFKLTVKEGRALCDKMKDHPLVPDLRNSLKGLGDNVEAVVDRTLVQAIIQNKMIEEKVVAKEVDGVNRNFITTNVGGEIPAKGEDVTAPVPAQGIQRDPALPVQRKAEKTDTGKSGKAPDIQS